MSIDWLRPLLGIHSARERQSVWLIQSFRLQQSRAVLRGLRTEKIPWKIKQNKRDQASKYAKDKAMLVQENYLPKEKHFLQNFTSKMLQ